MKKLRPLGKKSAQKRKKGSTECRTQSYWSGVGVKEYGWMDVVMKGEESQKRKKSSKMQNVNKIGEQSG